MRLRTITVFATAAALLPFMLRSDETSHWKLPPESAAFKPGPGVELVLGQCLVCHSADYVSTQPPLDRAGWAAIVTKMREKYGAPILTNTVDSIVTYLSTVYGPQEKR